jgi:hypothetical protein
VNFYSRIMQMSLCITMASVFPAASQTNSALTVTDTAVSVSQSTVGAPTVKECVPPCRVGYICVNGNCVSACNPPCPEGTTCNGRGECVSLDMLVKTTGTPKKMHRHTGLFLSMSGGVGGSVMNSSPQDTSVRTGGLNIPIQFDLGYTVRENLIIYGSFDMNTVEKATIERNNVKVDNGYGKTSMITSSFGVGARYYYAKFNAFGSIGATINMATISVYANETDQQSLHDYTSDVGMGFIAKIGKEWWISNRWALGGSFVYSLGYCPSGNLFDTKTNLLVQNYGILFTATFN